MHDYRNIEAEDYYEMAVEWIKQRNYPKAEECLKHVLELNPRFIYAYIDLADVYARQGGFHDAIHTLKKATHTDPTFDRLYYLMARYAFKEGDYRNALHFIGQACELNPSTLHERVRGVIEDRYHHQRR